MLFGIVDVLFLYILSQNAGMVGNMDVANFTPVYNYDNTKANKFCHHFFEGLNKYYLSSRYKILI
jgi:hypothetical protein